MAVVDELYIECTVRAKACLLSQTGQEITIGEAETTLMAKSNDIGLGIVTSDIVDSKPFTYSSHQEAVGYSD